MSTNPRKLSTSSPRPCLQGDEWEEKWGEWWASLGRANKWADKWGKDGGSVWHEKWGEDYDGEGGCIKYTDKVRPGLCASLSMPVLCAIQQDRGHCGPAHGALMLLGQGHTVRAPWPAHPCSSTTLMVSL